MRRALIYITVLTFLSSVLSLSVAVTYDLGNFQLTFDDGEGLILTSKSEKGLSKQLTAHLGVSIPKKNVNEAKVSSDNDGKLQHVNIGQYDLEIDYPNPDCTRFTWTTSNLTELRDCVDFGSANWYGGPEQREQLWPIEKLVLKDYSYVTKELDNMGLAERIWINSDGYYLYAVPEVPLFIDSNATGDNQLCFVAKFGRPYLQVPELMLRYSVCSLPDAMLAQNHFVTVTRPNAFPRAVPDQRMVEHPIWSTWARYKKFINESVVETFAYEILSQGYLNSQLEIDDDWETCYGELSWNLEKFPDAAGLSRRLKALGFRVTLWIHPFVNFECPSFDAWRAAGYFVHDEAGNVWTQWWNGARAAIVDFTNPNASSWFVNRLLALKAISEMDAFKYDAGETGWLPYPYILNADYALQPNIYTADYMRALDIPELGPLTEVRVGFETQDLPIFVRMVDKDSLWSIRNGLRSIVTTLLNMNMVGYSTVLPDMIGGNGYLLTSVTPELFVRWLQATTFMPSIQFSYVPWQFQDAQISSICILYSFLRMAGNVQLLSVVILLLVTSPLISTETYDLGNFELTLTDNAALVLSSSGAVQQSLKKNLHANIGLSIPKKDLTNPLVTLREDGKLSNIKFGASAYVDIDYPNDACTQFTWSTPDLPEARDCVDFGTANWYGGPEQKDQYWPIEKLVKQNYSYVTKEEDNMGIAERIWINSEGLYFYVVPEVPLFIDSNATGDNQLCFVAKFEQPYLPVTELMLRYSLCSLPDAIQAQNHFVTVTRPNAYPRAVPDQRMVEHPIWSTWARYKKDINESVVEQFAYEIVTNGYLNSQIEIDDDWETCYGELTFNLNKFPSPVNLTRRLKAMGFRVTLWVHPFVNLNCPSHEGWRRQGFFVKDEDGNVMTQWWNGQEASIVDFTNPDAADWYVNRLLDLKSSSEAVPEIQPNVYSANYVRALDLPALGSISEVRSGFETQDLPVFVRMVDKDTRWGINNGLRSMVTTLMAMNMAGYSSVLPDMIGGNGYGSDAITPELFIRWLQATTFMPSLQFSYVPWQFGDNQTNSICKKFVDLHSEYTATIMRAMINAVTDGKPVNTPIFYAAFNISGDDPAIFAIDDQYMLGSEILVAPVMDEGATSRDIYLPSGMWLDMNDLTSYEGGQWLRNYSAPLDVLPYFQNRIMSSAIRLSHLTLGSLLMLCAVLVHLA
ncbi:hypothetical protein B566_EDAN012299 [Ephemera danica]|nr:hypothetical protein B566_EDAN012299 [Ephemera danica]